MKNRTKIVNKYGVIPITIYTANFGCDISCIYCPTFKSYPKSYLKNQDTERARNANFSASRQAEYWINKINKTTSIGKPIKLELIVLGGTFSSIPNTYRTSFFKNIYDTLNKKTSPTVEEAIYNNRYSKYKACIVTIETRPDLINNEECMFLQKIGVTKVELGVQSIYREVLNFIGRPYTANEVVLATNMLKSYGFKVGYHLMINLPKSNTEKDKNMFCQIFSDRRFIPDYIKIYPTTLVKAKSSQKRLWYLYEKGDWSPYSKRELIDLISKIKSRIPPHVRLQRIQRQFGHFDHIYNKLSIRNEVNRNMKDKKINCYCLRCRELKTYNSDIEINKKTTYSFNCKHITYNELFIEAIFKNILLGYIRIYCDTKAIIREIKVVGRSSPVGTPGQVQENGVGHKLVKHAINCVRKRGYNEIYVNAGPGAKGFFKKINFKDCTFLMQKKI